MFCRAEFVLFCVETPDFVLCKLGAIQPFEYLATFAPPIAQISFAYFVFCRAEFVLFCVEVPDFVLCKLRALQPLDCFGQPSSWPPPLLKFRSRILCFVEPNLCYFVSKIPILCYANWLSYSHLKITGDRQVGPPHWSNFVCVFCVLQCRICVILCRRSRFCVMQIGWVTALWKSWATVKLAPPIVQILCVYFVFCRAEFVLFCVEDPDFVLCILGVLQPLECFEQPLECFRHRQLCTPHCSNFVRVFCVL